MGFRGKINLFAAFPDACVDPPLTDKRLPWVICHSIVDDNKHAWFPFEGNLICLHEIVEIINCVIKIKQRRAISKDHDLIALVSRVNRKISSNKHIEKGFLAVWPDSNSRQHLRCDTAVPIFKPFESRVLFTCFSLSLLSCLYIIHRFPRPAESWGWVIFFRGNLAVLNTLLF